MTTKPKLKKYILSKIDFLLILIRRLSIRTILDIKIAVNLTPLKNYSKKIVSFGIIILAQISSQGVQSD